MSLELISFKLCPYVQRSVITLLFKGVDFDITHINIAEPPEWFQGISPFGKVPLLKVDGSTVIFESAVICEYLDETTPGRLLPEDALLRAIDRSWIDFGSACIVDLNGILRADSQQKYETSYAALSNKLTWLESIVKFEPYFNGETISLVDFAYAPLFMRMQLTGLDEKLLACSSCQQIARWSDQLLAMECVQQSVVPDFKELLFNMIRSQGVFAAKQLGI